MKIGVDISALQTGHRMRGIGYTLINFINHVPIEAKKAHTFVFFAYPTEQEADDPLKLLHLDGLRYELRTIHPVKKSDRKFPGKLRILNSVLNYLKTRRNIKNGDPRMHEVDDLDWFLQFDQNQPLPLPHKVKSALIIYDLIQYAMEPDYLWSYKTARLHGHSRKSALRHHLRRKSYASGMKRNAKRAARLLAISEYTKRDFVKFLDIDPSKITVSLLGVGERDKKQSPKSQTFNNYTKTSWGYFPKKTTLGPEKFILFVGGADPRRRLAELVAAFNNLRAQGEEVKLVFTGDTMKGALNVPNVELQHYLKRTSYLDDIYFFGFVTEDQRDWLYEHAVAFVYPSVYEGFGLPVLEAMQYGTPVITYDNSSLREVAGDAALYARDFQAIAGSVKKLLHSSSLRRDYAARGKKQAGQFSWDKTAETILKSITG